MRTIEETAKAWDVQENTVWDYIRRGYIFGLTAEKNSILLPEIPKPNRRIRKASKITTIDKQIIQTLDRQLYLNAIIAMQEPTLFRERIDALVKAGIICQISELEQDVVSTLGYILTAKLDNESTKSKFNLINVDMGPSASISISGASINLG